MVRRKQPQKNVSGIHCPNCRSSYIHRIGLIPTKQGKKARLRCVDCGKTFYEKKKARVKRRKS